MATRPRGYGLTAEIKNKMRDKYDENLEIDARRWMESLLQTSIAPGNGPDTALGMDKFHEILKDGTILCKVINVLKPGSVKKINERKMPFLQMENISSFLEAAENYGLSKVDAFQTVDLYEKQNMAQVLSAITALGRRAQMNGFDGPTLGPKESAPNVRHFDESVLRAGESVIGLQAGSNKGASQAGMNIGKTRAILD